MTKEALIEAIKKLKNEKDAILLAHYYTPSEIQEIADVVGDSFYLCKVGKASRQKCIVFCGVQFMGESAKMLNPEKTILMPDLAADCSMAHMATVEQIEHIRRTYEDVAVVCYINSSAALKAVADVCVTSSNAVKIVRALKERYIYFIPDQNLGRFVAAQVPEKTFMFNEGHCCIHTQIKVDEVKTLKALYPDAKVLAHPECTSAITALADFVGSTLEMIDFAKTMSATVGIICTEYGIHVALEAAAPQKKFVFPETTPICADMKYNTLEKVYQALLTMAPTIEVPNALAEKAVKSLERMMELGQ